MVVLDVGGRNRGNRRQHSSRGMTNWAQPKGMVFPCLDNNDEVRQAILMILSFCVDNEHSLIG